MTFALVLTACASSSAMTTNTAEAPTTAPLLPYTGNQTSTPLATATTFQTTQAPTATEGMNTNTPVPTKAPTATSENAMVTPTEQVANMVQVVETEFKIDMPTSIPAGPTIFEIANQGTVQHSFEIEGQGIKNELEGNLNPGESAKLQVNLQPGTYHIYCPVDSHEDLGMSLQLTVTEN